MTDPTDNQTPTNQDEQAWIWLEKYCRTNDSDALHALLTLYQKDMYAFAVFMLRRKADAEDAVQEACLAIVRKRVDPKRIKNVRKWLLGTIRNVCLMQMRSTRRRDQHEDHVMNKSENSISLTPEKTLEDTEIRKAVMEQVKNLPDRYRMAVFLRYYQGLSEQEVADILNEPAGTLRSQLSRAVEKIRSRLTVHGVTLNATALLTSMATMPEPHVPTTLTKRISETVYNTNPAQHSGIINANLPQSLSPLKMILGGIGCILLVTTVVTILPRYSTKTDVQEITTSIAPSPDQRIDAKNKDAEQEATYSATWDFNSELSIDLSTSKHLWYWGPTPKGGAMIIRKPYWGKFVAFTWPHDLPNRPLLITCQVSTPIRPHKTDSMALGVNFVWRTEKINLSYRTWATPATVNGKRKIEISTFLLGDYAIQKVDNITRMVFKFAPSTRKKHMSMLVKNCSIHQLAIRELEPEEYEAKSLDPKLVIRQLAQQPDCSIQTHPERPALKYLTPNP